MKISTAVRHAAGLRGLHGLQVRTDGRSQRLLMAALATCDCNDLHREAARPGLRLDAVEAVAEADFAGVGRAATNTVYCARVDAPRDAATLADLLRQTDAAAEAHNGLRAGARAAPLKDVDPASTLAMGVTTTGPGHPAASSGALVFSRS